MPRLKVLIVYAHPEPTSFTGALKNAAVDAVTEAGHEAIVSDLYAEQFNPVAGRNDFRSVANSERLSYQDEQDHASRGAGFAEDIAREHLRLSEANAVILVFPLWWGGVPAILKGWFDRVLATGVIASDGRRFETGYLRGRRAMIAMSTGATTDRLGPEGMYGEVRDVLHGVRRCVLEAIGLDVSEPYVAYASPRVDSEVRERYLDEWSAYIREVLNDDVWVSQASADPASELASIQRTARELELSRKPWLLNR